MSLSVRFARVDSVSLFCIFFSRLGRLHFAAMSSLIDSTAQFESQMRELGIQQTLLDGLKQHGVRTLSQLAFSVGQPGQPILDQSVETLVQAAIGRAPNLTEAACLKRLAFEAQTYLTATLRQAVDRSEDAAPRKVPMAERSTRMDALKAALGGLDISGEHEPAHGLLDKCCAMFEQNSIKYVEPSACISRSFEVQGSEKKNRELTLERGSLILRNSDDRLNSPADSEIKLHYAMVRRGLAFEFAKLMSFSQHSQWEKFLFEAVHRETPPGFSRPSLLQIVQCDKAAFSRLGSTMTSIRQNADGSYPLGEELLKLRSDPHIALYLMPSAKQSSTSAASHQGPRTHPYSSGGHTTKGKGGGKTKSKQKGSPPIPSELRGKWHKTPSGDPICFGFNCRSGCAEKGIQPGQRCSKGFHLCAEPRCQGEHSLQQHGSK